jgi:hypothetical protein
LTTQDIAKIGTGGICITGAKDLDGCFPSPIPIVFVNPVSDTMMFLDPLLFVIFSRSKNARSFFLNML